MRKLLFIAVLSWSCFSNSQTTSGKVFQATTKLPLEGVSVYFDGTTIGTITDQNGYFEISLSNTLSAPLIISFLGFETQQIANPFAQPEWQIPLTEKVIALDEVVLQLDTWSREKKMNHFKREFLGVTTEALSSKILNEKKIGLRYDPSSQVLSAYCNEPIIIVNKYLGFKIAYNLARFNINYKKSLSGLQLVGSVFYSGSSFFEELDKKTRRKHLKNREKAYYGSTLHFMRSLAGKKLHENKFRIFYDKFEVRPYKHFIIEPQENFTKVSMNVDALSILYDGTHQSGIEFKAESFYIDYYGNYDKPNEILLSGDFGLQRISKMLPLDYALDAIK